MAEYMHFSHHKDRELDKTYKEYQTKHGKNYTSLTEHERRKHIFKHNLRCLYFNLAYCIGSPSICFDRVISVPHLTYIFISSFILFYGHYSCTSTWRRIQYTKGRYIWEGTPFEGGHLTGGGTSGDSVRLVCEHPCEGTLQLWVMSCNFCLVMLNCSY